MFARLTGQVEAAGLDSVIVDVSGVGYLVHASARTLSSLSTVSGPVTLLIETIIREDSFTLVGFLSEDEKACYKALSGVQGVGSKAALSLLSALPPEELHLAISSGDKTALTRADGVGPKLASRLLTELADRFGKMHFSSGGMDLPMHNNNASEKPGKHQNGQDALSALVHLGYARSDAFRAVNQSTDELGSEATIDQLIKESLKRLS